MATSKKVTKKVSSKAAEVPKKSDEPVMRDGLPDFRTKHIEEEVPATPITEKVDDVENQVMEEAIKSEVPTPVKGKLAFGIAGLNNPTPMWVTWIFRVVINVTAALVIWVATTGLISDANKVEVLVAFKALDYIVWGLGRFFGIKKEDFS